MAIVRSIGKNTLGGGKKMNISMREYERSTHDLSFVFRSPQAPGTLVPAMKILALPGDTFDISCRKQTMTHPTLGPLFGSFKQQTDVFFCPIRLYQALLHNNTLYIGMDMKKVKLPQIIIEQSNAPDVTKYNSSLLAYLGLRGYQHLKSDTPYSNAVPIHCYYDIFKNYYANKQEPTWHTIGVSSPQEADESILAFGYRTQEGTFVNLGETAVTGNMEQVGIAVSYNGITIEQIYPRVQKLMIGLKMGSSNVLYKPITEIFDVPSSIDQWEITEIREGNLMAAYFPVKTNWRDALNGTTYTNYKYSGLEIKTWKLTDLDEEREYLLSLRRDQEIISKSISKEYRYYLRDLAITIDGVPTASLPQFGLALKTYQSDIFTNWVNSDWVDGENGVNAITKIDTSEGSFSLDSLNMAQKVYNMLNRIAVSDGSYNSWIETVYTAGGVPHYETPVYIGGWSNEIEFQEVISNAATADDPLGSLAGRGVSTNHKGGNIHFKVDEPGYIMAINSITPRVDYSQYRDFDLDFDNMDELHKPALDGIGFQDLLFSSMNSQASYTNQNKAIGKQPAWIHYMTNFNKTFGDFAELTKEGWMVLNRKFSNEATEYTTYIDPEEYNYIFAQTSLEATNFWCQIAFTIQARRKMSAAQIPNL